MVHGARCGRGTAAPGLSALRHCELHSRHFKEGRALRTETVICDTRDFGIGRKVNAENWHALYVVGQQANRRLCDAQASDAVPAPDTVTLAQVTCPSDTPDGLHAPGLRFGDPRSRLILRPGRPTPVSRRALAVVSVGSSRKSLLADRLRGRASSPNFALSGYQIARLHPSGRISTCPAGCLFSTRPGHRVCTVCGRVKCPGRAYSVCRLPNRDRAPLRS